MKKTLPSLLIIVAFSLCASSMAVAATLQVPSGYPTIQVAIDAASPGDKVKVAAGTYNENITLKSGITVEGVGGANNTIIQGTGSGPVVTVENVSDAKIDGFTITGGYSETGGGGIYCYQSSPTITNNTIRENSGWYGGGIYCENSSPTISNNTFTGNSGWDYGGGIYCENSSPTISNNTFTGNYGYEGGGIYCYQSSPIITKNTIAGNNAEYGGGINADESSPNINNNTITGNYSGEDGGGVHCWQSSPIISNNTIKGNLASYTGGGIGLMQSSPIITNNIIAENDCGVAGGGINISWNSSPTIVNNTITKNGGSEVGAGGIDCQGSLPTITNSIIWGNGTGWEKDVDLGSYFGDYCAASYSCVGKPNPVPGGTYNIHADPMFVDAAAGDYHLQPGSPCSNAGNNAAVPSWLTTDYEGDPRIVNLVVDIGADEIALETGISAIYIGDGSPDPPINTQSNGVVTVAIAGSASFDIFSVDVGLPPVFGPDGARPVHNLSDPLVYADHQQDVNGDGYVDLVMHFKVRDTGIQPGDTEACLTFTVLPGENYTMCHAIRAR